MSTTNAASGLSSLNATAATPTTNPKSKLKVEDFINLMVTQLQNQDPTSPASNSELLQQMSQIGQLQSQDDLQSSLKTLVLQNNIGSAAGMIGKGVEGTDATTGETLSGKVKGVSVAGGSVMLKLDSGVSLQMSNVTSIDGEATGTVGSDADISEAVANSAGASAAAKA